MKSVWLSSTYYHDPAIEALSANAERFFTRALAYCGNAETSGYLSVSATKKLGLSRPTALVGELVREGILVERKGGGWDFRSWSAWNSASDELLQRRRADRERQARKRRRDTEVDDRVSREKSRDVTPTEESREEKNVTNVPKASHVSTPSEAETPRGPAINVDGWKLVREAIPAAHPQASKTELAMQAGAMLTGGTPPDDIRSALALWLSKPNLGPRTLPSLVSEVIRNRDRTYAPIGSSQSTADRRVADAQALKDRMSRKELPQ